MNIGLYSGVSAASSSSRRLEAISSNLANLDTPAFKRVSTATRAFRLPGQRPEDFQLTTHAATDFSQGLLQQSASPYHLALEGSGFFVIDGPEGELLTRNGAFHVDQNGLLLTDEGHPVSWTTPRAAIDPTGEIVAIDGAGLVRQGDQEIGRIRIVDYAKPEELKMLGGGHLLAQRGNVELPAMATVHQRMLEASNVSGIDELVAMINVQRSFESAQSVMRMIDQSYGRLTAAR